MEPLFPEPYRYVLDSSALFDLKRLYPKSVFKGVWNNFEELLKQRTIISVREVHQEIKLGLDWLVEWSNDFTPIFLYPSQEEQLMVREIETKYPSLVDPDSNRPNADPFVIACAKKYGLKIITHERNTGNKVRIPFVAKEYGLKCVAFTELFELEGWEF